MTTLFSPHLRVARTALAMVGVVIATFALSITTVLAWAPPGLTAHCAPDADHYAWRINLSQEPDYLIQLSWNSDFSNKWTLNFGNAGSHDFVTDRSGATLYVRWQNDTAKTANAAANGTLCRQPAPTPTPTPTPTATPTSTPTPTPTPRESELGGNPTPTPAPVLPDTSVLPSAVTSALALPIGLLTLSIASVAYAFARRR